MYKKPIELHRAKLENALEEILNKPFSIIVAPSGYGKTTALKLFFQKKSELQSMWIMLEHANRDEIWSWKKFSEVCRQQSAEVGNIMEQLGLPKTLQERDYFISIARKYIHKPICLILDDYHQCNSEAINQLIEQLIYEEIPNLHIIIISRTYPDIVCEKMILQDYCICIDQHMLSLDKEETKQVFEINGFQLEEQELKKIYEYTDGWISAVYLALYDYKRAGYVEEMLNINRLMKAAIFDRFTESMQEMCMKMSLLKTFTLEEACYVIQTDISTTEMAQLREEFGFMQFDAKKGLYTMHTLLCAVAGNELDKSNIEKKQIYERAGDYKERAGFAIDAIDYYHKAGAYEKILKVLSDNARDINLEQIPSMIHDILSEIPLDIKLRYPKAYLTYINAVIIKEDEAKGRKLYQELKKAYEKAWGDSNNYQQMKGELLIVEAMLEFNDLSKVTEKLGQSYDLLGHNPSVFFTYELLTFGAPSLCSLYYKKSGELKQTIALEKKYAQYHMRMVQGAAGNWDDLINAEYALMQNEVEEANILAKRAIEKATFVKNKCVEISSYFINLRSLIEMGDEKEFYQIIEEMERKMEDVIRPVLVTDYEMATSYLYACLGRLDKIPRWLTEFHLENCGRMMRNIRSGCVVYGIMLCQQKKWVLLDAVAEQILVPYDRTNHVYIQIFGHVFKSIALWNKDEKKSAWDQFLRAVKLAEPDNLRIIFVEMGKYLLPLIEEMGHESPFCISLKEPICKYQQGLKAFRQKKEPVLLTEREKELMHYVKEGLRNSDISEKMHIALVTVEKNLTNIYKKLNVSNRMAAIARMEEAVL